MSNQEAMGLLAEIADRAEQGTWAKNSKHPLLQEKDPTAEAYEGLLGDWGVLVVSFDVNGSRGHAGAASKGGVVIRLTPAIAERLFEVAVRKAPKE